MERVIGARSNIEQRLAKKLELLDGYGRVMNMIEIEVGMGSPLSLCLLRGPLKSYRSYSSTSK